MKTVFTIQGIAFSIPSFNIFFEKKFSLHFLLFFLFLLASFKGVAQDNTWTGGGGDANWSTATNWSLGVPTTTHRVVFDASCDVIQTGAVTVSAIRITNNAIVNISSTGVAHNFTCTNGTNSMIDIGSTLNLTGTTAVISLVFTVGGTTEIFVIDGTLNIGSNATFNSANSNTSVNGTIKRSSITASTVLSSALNLNFLSGGNFELAANAGIIPIATWNSNSTLKILGVVNGTLSGMAQDFGNVIWNCSGQISLTTFSPNSVKGNFNVQNTNSQLLSITTTPLTISGNYIQAGDVRIASLGVPRTWNIHGDIILNSGTLTLSTGTAIGTVNVKGNFTHSGGTITETASGSGQINFDGITTYTSGGTVSNTIDFTVNASKILTMAATGTVITGGGSFTLNSGSTLNIKSADGITTSGANGNILVTGARKYDPKAHYIYSGTNQTTGNGLTAAASLKLQGSATKTFSNVVTVSGNTIIANGVVVGLGSFASSTDTLTIKSEGTPKGTWGSTASSATYKNATYFGTSDFGTLNVNLGNCPPLIVSPISATSTAVMCFGGSNGSISLPTAETSGGTLEKILSYSWSKNGGGFSATLQSPSSLLAGTYSVAITATNANQCTGDLVISGIVVTQPAIVTASIFSQTNVLCKGNSTGSVTIAGSGGIGSYMYQLESGIYQSSNTFSTLLAGTYNMKVKDVTTGCESISFLITITEPASLPSGTISGTTFICVDSSAPIITFSGSGGSGILTYTYRINKGDDLRTTSNIITSTGMAGSFTYGLLRVTDANNCVVNYTTQDTATVTVNPLPIFTTTFANPTCSGFTNGSIKITTSLASPKFNINGETYMAGTSPYTFSTLADAIYTIKVKDGNSCESPAQTIILTQPIPIVVSAIPISTVCFGGNGSAILSATGGNGSYTFSSSGGTVTGNSLSAIAETYLITATDGNGCSGTLSITIGQPTIATSISASSNSSVCEASVLNLSSTPISSTNELTYAWTGPNAFTASTQNVSIETTTLLAAGTYTVTITDASSCVATAVTSVMINPSPSTFLLIGTGAICNGVSSPITLSSSETDVNYTLKVGGSVYNGSVISGAGSTLSFIPPASPTGIYTIEATNIVTGCKRVMTGSVETSISTNPSLSVTSQTNVSCLGGSDGTVNIIASLGSDSYNYTFNGGTPQETGVFTGKSAGTFPINAIDVNTGCVGTTNVTITEPTSLPSATVVSSGIACLGNTVTLTAITTDGTAGYTYNWNGTGFVTSNSLSVTTSGVNIVTIKDSKGCISAAIASTTVTLNALPVPIITGTTTICSGSTLNLTANNGITYAWSGPNSFNSTTAIIRILNVQDPIAGVYSVIVTNANGCSATATSLVIVNAMPMTPTVQTNVNIQSGISITLTATGCTGTLIWFNAADNSSVPMPVSPTSTTNYYAKCEMTINGGTCISLASENVTVAVEQLVIFSLKSGDWEDLTTWNIGRLPLVSEEVTIDKTHTITITTDTQATAKKIIYKLNATLNFSNTKAKLTLRSL